MGELVRSVNCVLNPSPNSFCLLPFLEITPVLDIRTHGTVGARHLDEVMSCEGSVLLQDLRWGHCIVT